VLISVYHVGAELAVPPPWLLLVVVTDAAYFS